MFRTGTGGLTGIAVDMVLVTSGTNLSLISTTSLNTDAKGNKTGWTIALIPSYHDPATHWYAITGTLIRKNKLLCAGVNYDGSTTKICRFNLTQGISDALSPLYNGASLTAPAGLSTGVSACGISKFNVATGGSDNSFDNFVLNSTLAVGYASLQASFPGVGGSYLRVEGQVSGVTGRGKDITIPDRTVEYLWNIRLNKTSQRAEICLIDNTTGALLGVSEAATDVSDMALIAWQDYLLNSGGGGGNIDHGIIGIDWTNAAFPLDPVTVPQPSITASQTATNTITIPITSVAQRFKIERSANAGSSWSTLNANYDIARNTSQYVDSTANTGGTYIYRVTALVGSLTSVVSASSSPVTVSGLSVSDDFESYPNTLTDFNGLGSWVDTAFAHFESLTGGKHIVLGAANSTSVTGGEAAYWNDTWSANHSSAITLGAMSDPTYDLAIGCAVRINAARTSWYGLRFTYVSGVKKLQLFGYVLGVGTQIGSDYATTVVAQDQIRLLTNAASGSSTRLTLQQFVSGAWANVATNVDPLVYIDGGRPGLFTYNKNGYDTALSIDAWTGAEV